MKLSVDNLIGIIALLTEKEHLPIVMDFFEFACEINQIHKEKSRILFAIYLLYSTEREQIL